MSPVNPSLHLQKLREKHPPAWVQFLPECITDAAWSPDGRSIAVTSLDGQLTCHETSNGKWIWSVPEAHADGASWCSFHPQHPILATGGQDATAKLWNSNDGKLLATLPHEKGWVDHGSWSPDGSVLGTAAGRYIFFWDPTGQPLFKSPQHASTVSALVWKPGKSEMLSAYYGGIHVWSPDTGQPLRSYPWKGSILVLKPSPDGRWLASGNLDSSLHIWNVSSGEDLEMTGYATKVRELSWSQDGRYLASGGGYDATVWDFSGKGPAGSTPKLLAGHAALLSALAFHPKKKDVIASSGMDGQLLFWNLHSDQPTTARALNASTSSILRWSPDGQRIAAGTEEGELAVWEPTV